MIKGLVEKKYNVLPLELQISKKGKKAKVNHLEQEPSKPLYWLAKCGYVCT